MKYKLHDVLAVVSLTEEGKVVLQQAMYLQKLLSFRIFVLYVIPPIPFSKFKFNALKVKELKDEAMLKLNNFVSDYFGGQIPENVILKVLMGNLVPTLIDQSQGEDFLFIILKRSILQPGINNLLVQKEIDKIIGHSYCPVLSINKESTPEEIKSILIPIDISEGTSKRLLWASTFAKITKAKIHIVSALNINMDEQKSLASKNAEKLKLMLQDRGIESDVEILKVHGVVKHKEVLSYIEARKPDFVIIRKHHVASYSKTNVGDFAKEIIHGSTIPVFTVSQTQKDIENILP